MRSKILILGLMVVLALALSASVLAASPSAPAASCTWNGTTGNWSDSTRWSCGAMPGAGDTATINVGTVTVDQEVTVQDLTIGGGTLQGSNTVTVTNGMTWTNGTLSGSGATTIASGAVLTITANGDCVYTAGVQLTGRTLNIAGTATLTGTNSLCAGSGIINNSGLFDLVRDENVWWNGGSSAILNNTGIFRKSGGTGTSTWSSVVFNNAGVVQVQSGTLKLSKGGTSSGSYTAAPGAALDFGGGTHTISLTTGSSISGAGTMRVSGGTTTIGGSGAYTVTGNTDITGGTLNVDLNATTAKMTFSGGTLAGNGGITVTNVITWTGGAMSGSGATTIASGAALTITANGDCVYTAGVQLTGRTLNIAGTATLTGTNSLCAGSGIINNSGLFDLVRDENVWWNGGSSAILNNTGIFRKSGGAGTSTWSSVAMNNTGTVQVQSGTLRLSKGGTSSGSYTAASGAALDFGGGTHAISLTAGSSISGAGTMRVSGGTTTIGGSGAYAVDGQTDITGGTLNVDLNATTAKMTMSGGTLQGSNTVTVTNGMTWTNGTLSGSGATTIASGAVLTITANGDCVYTAGTQLTGRTLNLAGTAMLTGTNSLCVQSGTLNNSGLFDIMRDVNVSWNGASNATLNNLGTFRKSGGTGTSMWSSVAINNAGAIHVQSGALRLANIAQNSGATVLNGGSLESPYHPLNLYGGALQGTGIITGNVANLGGTVSPGNSPGTLCIVGNYTQGPTGTLNIELGGVISGTQYDVLNVTGAASLSGTLNVSLIDGFAPITGTIFQVINYGSRSGGFSTINGLSQDGGLTLLPLFSANNLSLLAVHGDVATQKFAFSPGWSIGPDPVSGSPRGQLAQRYLLRYFYNSPNLNPPELTAVVTDTLPAALSFESETHAPAMDFHQQGNILTWHSQSPVRQGQSGLIQLGTFSASATAGQIITNQAGLSMGLHQYAMQAVSQIPLFPPIITWPGSGEIYSGTLDVIGVAQPGVTVTLHANNSFVTHTLADPSGVFTATYVYPGTGAVTLKARACIAGPLCSDDSAPVTLTPPQSFWCPQRSIWAGTPASGTAAGRSLAFRFRNNTGQFSTQNWIIPGVYGFWNTSLTVYVGYYPSTSTPPDQVWVIADGRRYDVVNVIWPWYTFLIGPAHNVEICAQLGSDSTCDPGDVLIDPDGYVFDVTKGLKVTASVVDTVTGQIIPTAITNTLQGVTVTAMVSMPQWGGWTPWPAHLYEHQLNPQVTGENGYFAFFTPPGEYYLQVDGIAGYQAWRSPIVHVITEIVHVNVPLTPIGTGASTYAVTLTQVGPSPAVITVPFGSEIEWTAELSGSLPIEQLAGLIDNPVLRPLSARNPLVDTLGWDGGLLTPGQVYRRQIIRPGVYQYADGMGHTGQVIVPGSVIYLPLVLRE